MNIITKSGGNTFHDDEFEYVRNGALNARNYFSSSVDPLKQCTKTRRIVTVQPSSLSSADKATINSNTMSEVICKDDWQQDLQLQGS